MKVKAWGIKQAVMGADYPRTYWFASKEARDEYYEKHDHCDKLNSRMIETEDSDGVYAPHVYADYAEFLKMDDPAWPYNV
jgi:hypothetical protein